MQREELFEQALADRRRPRPSPLAGACDARARDHRHVRALRGRSGCSRHADWPAGSVLSARPRTWISNSRRSVIPDSSSTWRSSTRHSALELGERLALGQVRAKALIFLAENAAWRGDRAEMERYLGLAASISPDDQMLAAFAWGARGMREMLHGDRNVAVEHLGRAVDMLADQPYAEPACFRAVWPLLLASIGDRRALRRRSSTHAGSVSARST